MHPLLERQIRKTLRSTPDQGSELGSLLRLVERAYVEADTDRKQLEHSLHLASDELYERNRRMESELEERKRLEVELQLAEKMRAIGQLAAGISHEINTPIQFIGDSLYFLKDAFSDMARLLDSCAKAFEAQAPIAADDIASVQALIEEVDWPYLRREIPCAITRCRDGAERVTTIVRALKTFAHPDASEQEPADINAAIRNTLVMVANEIKYVADIELDLAAERHVRCHVGEVQQVLLNLLVNAGHATAERLCESGGRGVIRISTRDVGDCLAIAVADQGTGIPESLRSRIFEPFFTTKPVGQGTGQGLSIVRSLVVQRHGGRIDLESTVGQGTTFTVYLPIAGKPRSSSPVHAVDQASG